MTDATNPESNTDTLDHAQDLNESNLPTDNVESSTTSEEQHEPKHNGVQKRINEITAQRYAAERERDELRKQLEEANKSKPQTPTTSDLVTPSLPDDLYDEDAMRKYHQDMVKYNQEIAQQAGKTAFETQQQQIKQQQAQQQEQELIGSYARNAISDGVDVEKLKVAETSLAQAGISPELGRYLMSDRNGGKIVEYLHDNQELMHEVLSMDPVSAGIKIATEIKPAALSTTPKVSAAPDPVPSFTGGGAEPRDDFESKNPGTEFI